MRVSVLCRAQLCRIDSDDSIVDPAILQLLDDVILDEGGWADYLADPLADAGVIGGVPIGQFVRSNAAAVEVRYWSPSELDPQQSALLVEETSAQISDGGGEGGLPFGDEFLVQIASDGLVLLQTEDDRVVEPASRVAICARENDLHGLRAALSEGWSVDGRLRGDPAIHLAILYGHIDAALELLATGANPMLADQRGHLPLTVCALSNSLSDEHAATIARCLIARGADPSVREKNGWDAAEYAANRNKSLLQSVLMVGSQAG
jgi:uncharacterized protein